MRARKWAVCLIACGAAVATVGYLERVPIADGARPYAYVSVMAVGAMLIVAGALLWRDSA